MLPRAVALVEAGNAPRFEQNHDLATYCAKRTPDDGLISWTDPAEAILRLIRAVGDPYPGAFTTAGGRKLTIDQANLFAESNRYIGLPGQVQSHTLEGFVVRCGDGRCIHVTSWRHEPNGKPRIHSKLGTGVA
jgi:methionyl-tRNA formyltransferase